MYKLFRNSEKTHVELMFGFRNHDNLRLQMTVNKAKERRG